MGDVDTLRSIVYILETYFHAESNHVSRLHGTGLRGRGLHGRGLRGSGLNGRVLFIVQVVAKSLKLPGFIDFPADLFTFSIQLHIMLIYVHYNSVESLVTLPCLAVLS